MSVDCVFCQVIAGTLPASVVYEDDRAIAFLDIFPVHAGHTLIVPRDHSADLRDCAPDLAAHLFAIGHRLAPAIVAATAADGFNIWTAAGLAAGQTVFHLHLHVLPRFAGDGFGPRLPKIPLRESPRIALDEMAARIRAAG